MRAQFATIEALLSFLVVLSAVSFVSSALSLNNRNFYTESSRLMQSIAIYDVGNQITRNDSTNGCVEQMYTTHDAACATALIKVYEEAFKLKHLEIATPGLTVGNSTSNSTTRCFSIHFKAPNETNEVCVVASN